MYHSQEASTASSSGTEAKNLLLDKNLQTQKEDLTQNGLALDLLTRMAEAADQTKLEGQKVGALVVGREAKAKEALG